MAGASARYGISALDLGHKDYAQNDELMVRADDGRMYYKRTDGVVVAYSDKDLSESEVITNTMGVLMGIDGLTLPDSEFIVYRTFDTTGKLNLISGNNTAIDRGAVLSPNVPGFFFRVRGNKEVSSAAAILKAIYANKVPNGKAEEVTVTITVSNNGADQQTLTVNTHLDAVTFVKFPEFKTAVTNYDVKIVSVAFPLFKAAYEAAGNLEKQTVNNINNGNETYEVNYIDFIGYAQTIASLADAVTTDVMIKSVTKSSSATETYKEQNKAVADVGGISKTAFVISKENPGTECMWGKIVDE